MLQSPIGYNSGMATAGARELASQVVSGGQARELHDEDPWSWSHEQVAAMKRRDFDAVDWENVIEEIGDVAGRDESAWVSYCRNVIAHLLKIEHSPGSSNLRHWQEEIEDWRGDMYDKLADNPGMRTKLPAMVAKAWRRGRRIAIGKLAGQELGGARPTRRQRRGWEARLPAECPYALEDIVSYDPFDKNAEPNPDIWPAPVAIVLNERLGSDYPVRYRA